MSNLKAKFFMRTIAIVTEMHRLTNFLRMQKFQYFYECFFLSKEYEEKWAPKHGGDDGTLSTVFCPAEGVITGIKYRAAQLLDSITFICTSATGISELGPFGGKGGTAGEEHCPPGSYISSIHGRSAELIDSLGIRCQKVGQAGSSGRRDTHGGMGGKPFDDSSFATNSHRPVQFRIRHADKVNMIQIKYGNMPVSMKCKVSSIVVSDKNIIAKDGGYAVIGLATGSSCSKQTQSLTVSHADTIEETTGVETSEESEFNWSTSVLLGYTYGIGGLGATSEVTAELSQSVGGSKTWASSKSKSTSTSGTSTVGAQVNYQGPGACVAIGVMKRYQIERDNLKVMYHFKCEAGVSNPQPGTIKLTSTTFNQASFWDYTHSFKTSAECSTKARQCVSSLHAGKIISNPVDIKNKFNNCFK